MIDHSQGKGYVLSAAKTFAARVGLSPFCNMTKKNSGDLIKIYNKLYCAFGPQGWWPGDSRFEMIVGAILTQNTAWTNVERAIKNLKRAKLISSPSRMREATIKRLAQLIRPAGYYNLKAKRLKNFVSFLASVYDLSLKNMSGQNTQELRRELLSVNGIGPETCDSILLYAFERPVFVVDAYTKRIFSRHKVFGEALDYEGVQKIFMDNLPADHRLYNEYHALIVKLGKEFCRKKPDCKRCSLRAMKSLANRFQR